MMGLEFGKVNSTVNPESTSIKARVDDERLEIATLQMAQVTRAIQQSSVFDAPPLMWNPRAWITVQTPQHLISIKVADRHRSDSRARKEVKRTCKLLVLTPYRCHPDSKIRSLSGKQLPIGSLQKNDVFSGRLAENQSASPCS
jgi:hypothetical protein